MYLKTYLPREHGGWFLFLVPLAVGLGVAWQWNGRGLLFAAAALALFLARQPLDLALKAWRGKRTRADLPALLILLAFYAALVVICGGMLLLRDRLWGLLPLAAAGAGLLALQLWAAAALARLIALAEGRRGLPTAIAYARRLLEHGPYHEPAYRRRLYPLQPRLQRRPLARQRPRGCRRRLARPRWPPR